MKAKTVSINDKAKEQTEAENCKQTPVGHESGKNPSRNI